MDMSALRKVIIANAAPSVTFEVRRGEESHKVSISKRASSDRRSNVDVKMPNSARRREPINLDETEVPMSSSQHATTRETVKSMVRLRQSSGGKVIKRDGELVSEGRPSVSPPPPIPPKSEEMSQNGGGLHMQTHEQLAGALQKGLARHSGAWEGAAGAPLTPPHSGSSRGSKYVPGGWATDAPSSGTNGTSPTLSSSSTRYAPAGGEGDGAWESLPGTPAGRRESSGGSIEELERGLVSSVNELAAQREIADALLLELSALKKKISVTARLHSPFAR